jgi:alcohol dehydrogenase
VGFEFQPRARLIFGEGAISRLGPLARELGFRRTLLVADRGLLASGHVDEASTFLEDAGIEVIHFHDFGANPDT